jgi:TPR repeat protein
MVCPVSDAPDHEQTLAGYRKAAAQGDAWAQFNLGVDYSQGRNAPQDFVQAYVWFSLAASGDAPGYLREMATGHRDLEATKMTPEQIAVAQKMAQEWKPK